MNRNAFFHAGLAFAVTSDTAQAATPRSPGTASRIARSEPPGITYDEVRRVIAANRKIVSPGGVEKLLELPVNGCRQWISIRGHDRRNPVLLYLHGGPGSPTMPSAWTFQSPWEDFFTVVQWDQRGAGKTYASNDPRAIAPTMNAEQMILDTEYVVRYLLEQFAKKKLFVLGHSWGSYLGLELARRHPGWLHAYVGTGQMIDSTRSEAEGYEFALQQARRHGNDGAVRELTRIAPYPGPIGALTVDRISIQRKWVIFYGGLTYGRSNFAYDAAAWRFAPEYTDRDVQLVDDGSLFSLEHLLGVVERTNFDAVTSIKCPLFLFQGRHDYETSYSVASQWFERVEAPQKGRVTFLNSSHMGMLEQPGEYLQHLVKVVRPLAVTVGDSAPSGVECSPCT